MVDRFKYLNDLPPDDLEQVSPLEIKKGYIFVTKPLTIEDDFGSWNAQDILYDKDQLKVLIQSMVNANPSLQVDQILPKIKQTQQEAIKYTNWVQNNTELEQSDQVLFNSKNEIRLAYVNNKFKEMIQELGFDSIRYKNIFETPKNRKPKYSYILFEPNQFKSTWASEFDIGDPRQNIRTGGLLRTLQRKKAA
jgi:hypothetical protein